ncbi:MAG TPA: hypothetical protein VK969_12975 [Acidimicrobiia bacterium]|nr:hypothetical protein [Acidimicrobiia bacterium]
MSRLDQVLEGLSHSVDWPEPAEHLPAQVAARIGSEGGHRPVGLRRWGWAAAAAALVLVALVPGAREAVADLFQEAGVRIGFVDGVSTDLGEDLQLGERVTIEEAVARADFELRYPTALDPPEETYIHAVGMVSMLWDGPILLSQRAGGTAYAEKAISSDTPVTGVEMADGHALWIEGAGHSFTYLDTQGNRIAETTRLAANVLLWSVDGVDHRLELRDDLDRALEIAESLEMVGS